MIKKTLRTQTNNVPIFIGDKIISISLLKSLIKSKDVVVITNVIVAKYHLKNLKNKLRGFNILTYIIPDGEKYKNIKTLYKIQDFLIKNNCDRQVNIIALGGGVIGDLVGLAADLFLRGVNLIHIPTTLLSQVDSSIGGKTGINHKLGKNLIGTFKQPHAVIISIDLLKTLPDKEFSAGMAEVVKYGAIKSSSFLKWLNKNADNLLMRKNKYVLHAVKTSVKEKIDVVQKDEKESGLRAILNFGHTLGHAIEAASNYKGILHGEAVSIGMVFAASMSVDINKLSIEEFNLLESTLRKLNLPTKVPKKLKSSQLKKHIAFDKKKKNGKNNFVLIKKIGVTQITNTISNAYLNSTIRDFIS